MSSGAMHLCMHDVHFTGLTMRLCGTRLMRVKGRSPMEFSNIILLIVGLGAAVLNPIFDLVAPKIAALFHRQPTQEPMGCG